MTRLDTARLALRPLGAGDLPALLDHWSLPLVRRWLWDDRFPSASEAATLVESSMRSWQESGYGFCGIVLRDRADLVGVVGFRESSWEAGVHELVYSLDPVLWGKGLATEAASAAVQWAFATRGWPRIVAATDSPNLASARVLAKVGLRFVREGTLENGLPTVFYEVTASH